MTLRSAILFLLFFALHSIHFSQDYPEKIRGYKLYDKEIEIVQTIAFNDIDGADGGVKLHQPLLVSVGLDGLAFDIGAEIGNIGQRGRIDMLMFRDFRVNGVTVQVSDYTHTFKFDKNMTVTLPEPVRLVVPATSMISVGYNEVKTPTTDWTITGTVLAFGKFKKYGFSFKRVVPIKVRFTIPNPIREIPDSDR